MLNLQAPASSIACQEIATPKKLIIDWSAHDVKVKTLAMQILASGIHYDTIIAVARGGLIAGTQLSHLLNKKLAVIFASSYHGPVEGRQGNIHISHNIATLVDSLGKRVLLVDDLVDSGVTLQEIKKILLTEKQVDEVHTAVLFSKKGAVIVPDYCVDRDLDKDEWIYLPYEKMPAQA